MTIADFMTQGVHTVRPHDTLDEAARVMWEHDCGVAPVVDGQRVVAMITDRDACMAAYTQGKPLAAIPVSSAMSRSLFACRPDDAPRTAERTMREHQVRRLPVVDDAGRLVGIVSLNDIALESTSKPAEIATTLVAICRHHNTALVATEHEMVTLRPSTA